MLNRLEKVSVSSMKEAIIAALKKSKTMRSVLSSVLLVKNFTLTCQTGRSRRKPKVIQLPITYKCNSRCVMCNVWKMDYSNEASVGEFSKFLSDPLFDQVASVGINGGEPSLIRSLPDYASEILKLPSIKSLNIISHGFNKKLLLKSIEDIYASCRAKGVRFHVSISLDGYGETHDRVRGIKGAFSRTMGTIDEIVANRSKYCDSFDLGCTVVNQNIDHLTTLDNYVRERELKIKYRLGIDNKRIESDQVRDQYSVIYSPNVQSASEFFHWQYSSAKNLGDKFKYFSLFFWLTASKRKRLLGCMWKEDGVTLDSRGNLYYCAVASKAIGSLRSGNGQEIFFSDANIQYRQELIRENCSSCIHDYGGKAQLVDVVYFIHQHVKRALAMRWYRMRLSIGWI